MTSPNGQVPVQGKPPFDPANQFQAELPTEWTLASVQVTGGQRAAVCFRTPNTTATYMLAKDDLGKLVKGLQQLHASMNGLILPPSGG